MILLEIDRKPPIQFENMRQSTWNVLIKSLEIGEVLDLIREYWRIISNRPIRLLNRRKSSWEVLKLIKRNGKINLYGPIKMLKGRGQLAWSGQSENPIMEGSRFDEANETLGRLEVSQALPGNHITRLTECLARLG